METFIDLWLNLLSPHPPPPPILSDYTVKTYSSYFYIENLKTGIACLLWIGLILQSKTAILQNKTLISQHKTAILQDKTLISQHKTAILLDKTLIPQSKTVIPQHKTAIPRNKALIPQDKTPVHHDSHIYTLKKRRSL
ncbi:hypothetical protein Holit_01821 [Hollandina sp. SP2]